MVLGLRNRGIGRSPRARRRFPWWAAVALVVGGCGRSAKTDAESPDRAPAPAAAVTTVELTPSQLSAVTVGTVATHRFTVEVRAVGTIDYDGDRAVSVFPPYQGRILRTFAALGDAVTPGQPLYTISSPDLIQAESTLIAAAGTYELTTKELARARDLYGSRGVPQRELEQATADQQAAAGALAAARASVRVFGKTDAQIDAIVAQRRVDPALVVRSPTAGQVTARFAPAGLFVQPGAAPAPFAVADMTRKWMLASVGESDLPRIRIGQPVEVAVLAYAGRTFRGKVTKIYPSVDPNVHRVTVRSDIADPADELRPGMLATFRIQVDGPIESPALPAAGVVREGDGTMTAWVTADRRHFAQRTIRTGLREDGLVQVLAGLRPGELAVTDGAIFLDNMLQAPVDD